MASKLKIEIEVSYEEPVTEKDRKEIDTRIDELLKDFAFHTTGNEAETPCWYNVKIVSA